MATEANRTPHHPLRASRPIVSRTPGAAAAPGPDRPPVASHLSDLVRGAMARLCAEMRHDAPTAPAPAKSMSPGAAPDARAVLGDPCAAAMAYALCDSDDASASMIVEDLLRAGLSVEEVCLDHLAPAARHLGDLWEKDRLHFADVTLATARIQAMLRRMPASRVAPVCGAGNGALFAALPGEQHTLGVMMAADLFRRNGWDVGLLVGLGHDDLEARLARDDRPVIGLTCSGGRIYPALLRILAAIARLRPDAHVLLSGQIVHTAPDPARFPMPVTIVADVAAAEAEMIRIEAQRLGSRAPSGRRQQAVSAA